MFYPLRPSQAPSQNGGHTFEVQGIDLNCRLSSQIGRTSEPYFVTHSPGKKKITLKIQNGSRLVLTKESMLQRCVRGLHSLTGVTVFGTGVSRNPSSDRCLLEGAIVVNNAMSGEYGVPAAKWLLSHILHGDLRISSDSDNSFFASLGDSSEGLRVQYPIAKEIVASLPAATDLKHDYLCLAARVYKVQCRDDEFLVATLDNVDVSRMTQCSIEPLRKVTKEESRCSGCN